MKAVFNTENFTVMKNYIKYICAILLLVGTSAHAWAADPAAPSAHYTLIKSIGSLSTGDRVIIYCSTNSTGVSGLTTCASQTHGRMSTVSSEWVEYLVTKNGAGTSFTLKDTRVTSNNYVVIGDGGVFSYGGTGTDFTVNDKGRLESGSYHLQAATLGTGDCSRPCVKFYTSASGTNTYVFKVGSQTKDYYYTVTAASAELTINADVSSGSYESSALATVHINGSNFNNGAVYAELIWPTWGADDDYGRIYNHYYTSGGYVCAFKGSTYSPNNDEPITATIYNTVPSGTYNAQLHFYPKAGSPVTEAPYHYYIPVKIVVTGVTCNADPTFATAGTPTTTSNLTSTSVQVNNTGLTSVGGTGCSITKYGYCWGTSTGPTVSGSHNDKGTSIGTSTAFGNYTISGLTPNTTYYIRPFATNDHGTAYGPQVSITTLQRYTITYDNNTGSGTISSQYKDHGATATLNGGSSFSKTGYDLDRWDTNSTGDGNSYALGGSYSANADVTMYAVWTPANYTITLDDQDATSTTHTTSISVTYNANTNLSGTPAITVPTKTGYEFGGYYTGKNGGGTQIIDEDGDVIANVSGYTDASKNWIYTNDIKLYAKWSANTISLTLNKNCASGTDGSGSVDYDATALTSRTDATNSDDTYHLVGYYAEVGTTTKVLESSGAFAASNVLGYITGGKWSRTTDPTTLYAKWSKTTYTVTFNMHEQGSEDDQIVESGSTAAQPATPVKDDIVDGYRFLGWFEDDGGSISSTEFDFSTAITANTTIHAKWEEITYSTAYKAWCEPDITITGDIHLTSVNGISVYATSTTSNLLRIQSNDLAGVNKLEIKYLDADNGDAEVAKGSSLFRLCNNGTPNYSVADGSQIDVSASNTYDQTFSISYTPSAAGVINHYKLQITMKHGNTNVLKTVTHDLYGRSLPEEFVVASKFGGEWYALPNTLETLEASAKAVAGVKITVDNTTTPTKAVYAPDITVYQGEGRYAANSNRYGVRLTDGTNHLQVSTTGSNNKMWLSSSGSANCQDWWLSCTDFSSYYTVTIPSNTGNESKKIGMDGGNIGYYATPTAPSGQIYFLPIEHELVDNPAIVTEWGQNSVILDVDAQGMAGAQARLGAGDPEVATTFKRTRTSVKGTDTKYNYTLNFSSLDFSLHKGELLYVDWLDGEGEVVSTSTITIPWIIASSEKSMHEIDGVQAHWNTEVHVLPGVTLIADAGDFGSTSKTVTVKQLEIYPGATVIVTKGTKDVGTLQVTDLVLRNGWTRAGVKEYNVARLFITPSTANLQATRAYADWYIDFDQYYPVAVPWDVTVANITYKNSNTAATINGTSGTLRLRYYDGASRAENGQVGVGAGANWKAYGAAGAESVPVKMVPSMGYAMTAKRPTGKAFSIVRMPLNIPSTTWTTGGEKGNVGETYKNHITVTAYGVEDASKPWYTVGWNFIANPYMATYNGDGDDSGITGKLKIQGSGSVKYATIPNLEFTNYDQLPVVTADLKPGSPFFVQVGTGGTLEFSNSKIVDPTSAPARYMKLDEAIPEQEAYIRLSSGIGNDLMGLIIGEDYTEAYELNADLTKVLGSENTVKTYMHYGDMDMAYVAINAMLAREWIPVVVKLPSAVEYTFSLTSLSEIEHLEGVYLIDYETNEITNLIEDDYVFTATAGTISDRFAINAKVGEREVPTDIDVIGADKTGDGPIKFLYRDKVYIWHQGNIYDATGKKVKGGQK